MKKLIYTSSFIFLANAVTAQSLFKNIEYLDVNNVKAAVALHGDMWWDADKQMSAVEFPKGSGQYIASASGIWLTAIDAQNSISSSTSMYRQHGVDFWPGPLDATGTLDIATSEKWARIWKVSAGEIEDFKKISAKTVSNVPAVILEWPAKGNTHAKGANSAVLSITASMAPYVDVNNDGKYNALEGDYPKIQGDQMLWYVISDNGPTHNSSNPPADDPLHVEIHVSAYAYASKPDLANTVFYRYHIVNKSNKSYTNLRFGIFSEADLGFYGDDYIGYDSSYRMAIVYNGSQKDGAGEPGTYAENVPVMGVSIVSVPGEDCTNGLHNPGGSFMNMVTDFSNFGTPVNALEYFRYMRSEFRDGTHLHNDFAGKGIKSKGTGAGPDADFLFPGEPGNNAQWSECISTNDPGDRRFILSTNDIELQTAGNADITVALVITDPGKDQNCVGPAFGFAAIKNKAQAAWDSYCEQLTTTVKSTNELRNTVRIYPNPASNELFIEAVNKTTALKINIYDKIGRKMLSTEKVPAQNKATIHMGNIPAGIYSVVCTDGTNTFTQSIVKD